MLSRGHVLHWQRRQSSRRSCWRGRKWVGLSHAFRVLTQPDGFRRSARKDPSWRDFCSNGREGRWAASAVSASSDVRGAVLQCQSDKCRQRVGTACRRQRQVRSAGERRLSTTKSPPLCPTTDYWPTRHTSFGTPPATNWEGGPRRPASCRLSRPPTAVPGSPSPTADRRSSEPVYFSPPLLRKRADRRRSRVAKTTTTPVAGWFSPSRLRRCLDPEDDTAAYMADWWLGGRRSTEAP